MTRFLAMALVLTLGACGSNEPAEPTVDKSDVAAAQGKSDGAELDAMCEDLGRDPGCDPCIVQGWYGDGSCDAFCPVRDTDCGINAYALHVELSAGLAASVNLVYQSSKDSFSCTDLTWDGVTPKRVPEQVDAVADATCVTQDDGRSSCEFTFPNELGDGCESVIRHIYLSPTDDTLELEPWASLSFIVDAELDAANPQVVSCRESNGQMMCGNDLLYHDAAGAAAVSLVLDP